MEIAWRFLRWPAVLVFAVVLSAAENKDTAKAAASNEQAIQMPSVSVTGTPFCSFGIGIRGLQDKTTRKVLRLFISDVSPGSDAEKSDLKVGDEILTINGKSLAEIDSVFDQGSALHRLLVNRSPGERLRLTVATRVIREAVLKAAN